MKFLIALVCAAISWWPVAWFIYEMDHNEEAALAIASIISIIIFLIVFNKVPEGKGGTSIASDAIGAIKDIKENIEFNLEEKKSDLFAQAEEEYENGEIDKGLWSQALVKAKGDENLRKVEYMKMRVRQLKKQA